MIGYKEAHKLYAIEFAKSILVDLRIKFVKRALRISGVNFEVAYSRGDKFRSLSKVKTVQLRIC